MGSEPKSWKISGDDGMVEEKFLNVQHDWILCYTTTVGKKYIFKE